MNYSLMADISGRGGFVALAKMARAFSRLVDACNRVNKEEIISRLTITLGDEFQGIVKEECSIYRIITCFEENKWKAEEEIHLRYAVELGKIETEINTNLAHGMMGAGVNRCEKSVDAFEIERRSLRHRRRN